jgi:hypothetical protein
VTSIARDPRLAWPIARSAEQDQERLPRVDATAFQSFERGRFPRGTAACQAAGFPPGYFPTSMPEPPEPEIVATTTASVRFARIQGDGVWCDSTS